MAEPAGYRLKRRYSAPLVKFFAHIAGGAWCPSLTLLQIFMGDIGWDPNLNIGGWGVKNKKMLYAYLFY